MDVVGLSYQHHQQDHPGDADVLAPAAAEAPQPDNAAQPATSQVSGTTSLPEDAKQPQAGPVPDSEVPEGDTNGNAKTDPGERPLGSKVVYVDDGNGNAVPPAGTSPEDAGLQPTGNYVGAMCPVYKNPYTGEEYTLPPVGNTEKEWFPVGILSVKN
jgi:hypothetical protein